MRTTLTCAALLAAALAFAAPASAQTMDLGQAGADALKAIRGAARESLLVGDMMGAKVEAPSGEVVGTVRNLVAIPGGQLVAVVIAPDDLGHPIFVPYKVVKLSETAEGARVTLPQALDPLRKSKAVTDLTDALGGLIPGTPKGQNSKAG